MLLVAYPKKFDNNVKVIDLHISKQIIKLTRRIKVKYKVFIIIYNNTEQ